MRVSVPCFAGTTLACLISTYCSRLEIYYILWCLSLKSLHNFCILIGLQNSSEKCFPPIHIPKALFKTISYDPEILINGPIPPIKYTMWPNIIDALGLMNLYTMALSVIPWFLSTVMASNVSNLSISNAYGVISFPDFSLLLPGRTRDIIQDTLWNKSSVWLDYIDLRTRLNKFEMFV